MRVLLDTNILISASGNAAGAPYQAFLKAISAPNKAIVCDQNIEEMRRVFMRKFPHKLELLEKFLTFALMELEVVRVPATDTSAETRIRDIADRPILRAAIAAKVDIIVTGDKDFLDSGVTRPQIMTAAAFLLGHN
jgi:putative PIN family toxin of toxin-antitoxin system